MEDIKVKLARIDGKFEQLMSEGQHTWKSLEDGLIMAKQAVIAEHLQEMEAAGMACPSILEVVS